MSSGQARRKGSTDKGFERGSGERSSLIVYANLIHESTRQDTVDDLFGSSTFGVADTPLSIFHPPGFREFRYGGFHHRSCNHQRPVCTFHPLYEFPDCELHRPYIHHGSKKRVLGEAVVLVFAALVLSLVVVGRLPPPTTSSNSSSRPQSRTAASISDLQLQLRHVSLATSVSQAPVTPPTHVQYASAASTCSPRTQSAPSRALHDNHYFGERAGRRVEHFVVLTRSCHFVGEQLSSGLRTSCEGRLEWKWKWNLMGAPVS